jgi:exonuclease VII small subunit
MPVVRASRAWRRGVRTCAAAMTTLQAGRRIVADLRAGLDGKRVAAAADGL